jgi:hypothetical protein
LYRRQLLIESPERLTGAQGPDAYQAKIHLRWTVDEKTGNLGSVRVGNCPTAATDQKFSIGGIPQPREPEPHTERPFTNVIESADAILFHVVPALDPAVRPNQGNRRSDWTQRYSDRRFHLVKPGRNDGS